MKAAVYNNYGPAEVIHIQNVLQPSPKDDEILINVHASSVTTGDVNMRGFVFIPAGLKWAARLMFGVSKPRKPILGMTLAGEVKAVGKDVGRFAVGDKVFGINSAKLGCHSEYVCWPANSPVIHKPQAVSYAQAAAVVFGASTALFFLRDKSNIQAGQQVLIHGASGSVGVYAVQLAKYFGAHVTAVCSGAKADVVKDLGADEVD